MKEEINQKKFGYSSYDLVSALQKDIRRGNEFESLFWAVKLESLSERSQTKLWNRLKVIASEDIGPANPLMPLLIETLEKQYCDARKRGSDACRLFLTNAVVNLVRCKKSRVTDDLLNIVYGLIQHEDLRLPIPDYAFDKHTSKGSRMGRGFEFFFSEGAKLENEAFENPYAEEAKEILIKYGGLESESKRKKKTDECQQVLVDIPIVENVEA
jgi:replication-associated recombination protein RarA